MFTASSAYYGSAANVKDLTINSVAYKLVARDSLVGNKIELLHNGAQIFPAMQAAIHGAKASVNFEAYLFYSDGVGAQFRDALCDRFKQRFGLDDGSDLVAQIREDLLCVVSLAEETPVNPAPQLFGDPLQ